VIDPRTAMMTGVLLGLLKNAEDNSLLLLSPRPRVDDSGDYESVIELIDANGRLVFTITLELQGGDQVIEIDGDHGRTSPL
jgi:hypothetical protein